MRAPSVCPAIFAFDPDALYCSPRNEPMSLQMPLGQLMSDAEFERLIDPNPFAMGTSRQTHNVIADRLVVVKKIKDGYGGPNFPNYIEWFIWSSVSETDLADYSTASRLGQGHQRPYSLRQKPAGRRQGQGLCAGENWRRFGSSSA